METQVPVRAISFQGSFIGSMMPGEGRETVGCGARWRARFGLTEGGFFPNAPEEDAGGRDLRYYRSFDRWESKKTEGDMGVMFFLLAFSLMLCAFIGLIKPSLVLQWGKKRTRGRAFGWYFLFAFLSLLIGSSATKNNEYTPEVQSPAETQHPKVRWETKGDSDYVIKVNLDGRDNTDSNEGDDKYLDESKIILLYCTFVKEMEKTRNEAYRKFGADPHNTFKKGDIITAGNETILQTPIVDSINDETTMMKKTSSISRINAGQKFIITRVISEAEGHHWYEAKILNSSQRGYIRSEGLFWYDTLDRSAKHLRTTEEWAEPRYAKLEKKFFTDNGLERWEVEDRATKGKWRLRCGDN